MIRVEQISTDFRPSARRFASDCQTVDDVIVGARTYDNGETEILNLDGDGADSEGDAMRQFRLPPGTEQNQVQQGAGAATAAAEEEEEMEEEAVVAAAGVINPMHLVSPPQPPPAPPPREQNRRACKKRA